MRPGLCPIERDAALETCAILIGIRQPEGAAMRRRDERCEVEPQSRSTRIART